MPPIDWELTLDTILSGKCILFLGPEVFTDDVISNPEQLLKHLDPNNKNIQQFNQGDDLLMFDDLSNERLVCHNIKTFYSRTKPDETLKFLINITNNTLTLAN